MQAEIVQVDQYDDGKYDWTEEAIIVRPSTTTEETFIKSLLPSGRTKYTIRLFDQKSYDEWVRNCAENRAKKLLEDEQSEGVETPDGEI